MKKLLRAASVITAAILCGLFTSCVFIMGNLPGTNSSTGTAGEITLALDSAQIYMGYEFTGSVTFRNFTSNPKKLSVWLENGTEAIEENLEVKNGKLTFNTYYNKYPQEAGTYKFYVKDSTTGAKSNSCEIKFWTLEGKKYSVTKVVTRNMDNADQIVELTMINGSLLITSTWNERYASETYTIEAEQWVDNPFTDSETLSPNFAFAALKNGVNDEDFAKDCHDDLLTKGWEEYFGVLKSDLKEYFTEYELSIDSWMTATFNKEECDYDNADMDFEKEAVMENPTFTLWGNYYEKEYIFKYSKSQFTYSVDGGLYKADLIFTEDTESTEPELTR